MSPLQSYFEKSLSQKADGILGIPIADFRKDVAQKLLDRVDRVRLYAHTYAFFFNFNYGCFDIEDLLRFAFQQGLHGISAYIDSGQARCLRRKTASELGEIRAHAEKLGLDINLEISSVSKDEVADVVRIARALNAKSIRVYIRHAGRVSEILQRGIDELKDVARIAAEHDLQFALEQHEDLKSHELVHIITEVNSDRIGLLFDFGNMINAYEDPLPALQTMAPYIRQVHLKGIRRITHLSGFAQLGVAQGEDDLPQMKMLLDLLMLGEDEPQVQAFSLEQEIGYYSPVFRQHDEDPDPMIPDREPSETPLDRNVPLRDSLLMEIRNACDQLRFVRNLLEKLKTIADIQLSFQN
jgi:sugar phosphate isomerase/epimerase